MRRLDRNRPYGTIHPPTGAAAFVQDHLEFDVNGVCLNPNPPPPPPEAAKPADEEGPPKGALSLSARTATEWRTVNFLQLRSALLREKGFNATNFVKAMTFLDQEGLVIKE